ncbi:hypothetical protein IUQ79_20800 [Mycobacteroides abscessus subsp. bolletii]|uniref:hypothetical protein n=1 Tax=Mycobacteroides abscessus TaxID=36809 RepID=UPI0019D03A54|nr:hypothetical protein [Mycobacteroides abscessus]MBN7304339.1 hypothetical protein [Mycobacteroides abscessus subsp. bolletii]
MTIEGVGEQYQNDPRGWLTFSHLPDELQRAEDATQAADFVRWSDSQAHSRVYFGIPFDRPATATERVLLEYLGYQLPEALTTIVNYPASGGGIRQRRWPALENSATP